MKNSSIKKIKKYYYHWLKFKNKLIQGPPVLVLMYHRINDVTDLKMQHLTVSVSNFEEQMGWLSKNLSVIRLADDWENVSRPSVVITFDDGYADNYSNALPILEKYQIPASIFVTILNIDSTAEFWWDSLACLYHKLPDIYFFESKLNRVSKSEYSFLFLLRYYTIFEPKEITIKLVELAKLNDIVLEERTDYRSLSLEELNKLQNHDLIDIGIHTHHHIPLSNLSVQKQIEELQYSKNIMESLGINYISFLALPNGSYNQFTAGIVEKEGFEGMLLANNYYSNKINKQSQKINRILVPNLNEHQFENYLKRYL